MKNQTRPLVEDVPSPVTDTAAVQAWSIICEKIANLMPTQAFQTWFQPLKPLSFENETLIIEVPSRFYYEWIEGHYATQMDLALDETLGKDGKLIYAIAPPSDNGNQFPSAKPVTLQPIISSQHQIMLTKTYSLNPRYTFENFIEGPGNSFARAASLAVGTSPGTTAYNPLLLYGGVGLGKTHLLQAIGNECLKGNPDLVVTFLSSERFTQDFVEAIRENRALEFSARCRAIDVLLLDDVQFLIDRERTQMEFFHTFNTLHQNGKQIVLTSDKPPRELGGLDERLVSRFGWGLVCDIGPPDYDTRLAIIQKFAQEECTELDFNVIDFLAQNITKNIRELQGALIRIFAQANLTGADINLDLARKALKDLCDQQDNPISIDLIQRQIADYYHIPLDLLISKTRTQPVARIRMIAMGLASHLTNLSLKQIGRHFGNRDHTTVMYARDSVLQWMKEDTKFNSEMDNLIGRIKAASV